MRRNFLRQDNIPTPTEPDSYHQNDFTATPRADSELFREDNTVKPSDSLDKEPLEDIMVAYQQNLFRQEREDFEGFKDHGQVSDSSERKSFKGIFESHREDFLEKGRITPSFRDNSELSLIANDDDTTVASDVLDNDETEAQFCVEDNSMNNFDMRSPSPNLTRTNSSAKSMITAKQRSNDEAHIASQDDDISHLIDNDEDALTEEYDSLRSPRVVNYLTKLPSPSHSSYLRRQRLTTASTLDIPQGVEEEEERTDNTFVRPPSPQSDRVAGKQSLAMQTLIKNYRPIQQGWLAKKVMMMLTFYIYIYPSIYTILYYTILYYTILYYTTLHYTILYYTILYYTILYYSILFYTVHTMFHFYTLCLYYV